MASKPPSEWFWVQGDLKKGPFKVTEIRQMLDQGEIRADSPVVDSTDDKIRTTVSEILKVRTDPVLTLFEALAATRKKGDTGRFEYTPLSSDPVTTGALSFPPVKWIILGILSFGAMLTALCQPTKRNPASADSEPPPPPPPVQRSAPVIPPSVSMPVIPPTMSRQPSATLPPNYNRHNKSEPMNDMAPALDPEHFGDEGDDRNMDMDLNQNPPEDPEPEVR